MFHLMALYICGNSYIVFSSRCNAISNHLLHIQYYYKCCWLVLLLLMFLLLLLFPYLHLYMFENNFSYKQHLPTMHNMRYHSNMVVENYCQYTILYTLRLILLKFKFLNNFIFKLTDFQKNHSNQKDCQIPKELYYDYVQQDHQHVHNHMEYHLY